MAITFSCCLAILFLPPPSRAASLVFSIRFLTLSVCWVLPATTAQHLLCLISALLVNWSRFLCVKHLANLCSVAIFSQQSSRFVTSKQKIHGAQRRKPKTNKCNVFIEVKVKPAGCCTCFQLSNTCCSSR